MGSKDSIPLLQAQAKNDTSKHVQHRCELAIGRIKKGERYSSELASKYASLDAEKFRQAKVGEAAPDFELKDTNGKSWRLSDLRGKTVVLIWIFADWCPVCRNEFHELIAKEQEYKKQNIQVLTIECHDLFRCQAMVAGRELWWPHLVDSAGAVGAMYGVDPMEFIVHDEWINRPSTIIVDQDGVIRFAYYGTFWGDRPTIQQTLKLIEAGQYQFEHPERRKPSPSSQSNPPKDR